MPDSGATSIGFAALQIIPVLKGLTNNLAGELGAPLVAAGRKAGEDTGKAVADGLASAKSAVEKASATLAQARNKEEDAAGKVRVAEAQLQSLRDKGITDAGRLAQAEEKIATARRNQGTAADNAAKAETSLATAEGKAADAAKRVADEAKKAETELKNVGTSADKAEGGLSKMAKVASIGAGLAVVGTAAVGASKSLLGIGETFANVNKSLSFTTGATGEKLDGMKASVENIAKVSPKGMTDIADVLGKVAQRTDLAGKPLENLTKQVLKLNGIQGDTDLKSLSGAMAAFGVEGKDTSAVLDQLFVVSQKTGVSVNELSAAAMKGAPQFSEFGFGLAESASLMGQLDKAGVSGDNVMTGLNRAFVNFAKAGKEPKQALADTVGELKKLTDQGKTAEATNLASSLFGTRGAGQFLAAVKSGAVTVDGLTASMKSGNDAIMKQGGAIPSMSTTWNLFKNNVLIALEPLATKVFGAFTKGITWIKDNGLPVIQKLTGVFTEHMNVLGPVIAVVAPIAGTFLAVAAAVKVWSVAQTLLNFALKDNPIGVVTMVIAGIIGAVIWAYNHFEGFRKIVQQAWKEISAAAVEAWNWLKPIFAEIKTWVMDTLVPAVMHFWQNVMVPAFKALGTIISVWWNDLVKPVFGFLKAMIMDVIVPAILFFWKNIVVPAFEAIKIAVEIWWAAAQIVFQLFKLAIQTVGDVLSWLWHNIAEPVFNGIGAALSAVWNSVLKPTWDLFTAAIGFVGDKANWLWHNVFEPVWDGIKTAVSAAWEFIKPLFDSIGGGIQTIGDIGSKIGGVLADAFRGVVDILKAPLHVLGGLLAAVPDSILGVTIPGASSIHNWGTSLQGLQDGGPVVGPGTGTSDSIIGVNAAGVPTSRVSAGEWVTPERAVNAQTIPVLQALRRGWVPSAEFLKGLTGYQDGGLVTPDDLAAFAQGVEGKPYVWGGVGWGDCSGAVSALANKAAGKDPFSSRFATGNEAQSLTALGAKPGLGPAGSLNFGWFNGGAYGGHTAATLPNGTHFEMGGKRGNGQYGGAAAGADDAMFTDHAHFGPEFFLGGDPAASGSASSLAGPSGGSGASGGVSGGSTPGGSGVDSTYQAGASSGGQSNPVQSFLDANTNQFMNDAGLNSNGALPTAAKEIGKAVQEQIHYHVTNIDEAMRKENQRRQQQAASYNAR